MLLLFHHTLQHGQTDQGNHNMLVLKFRDEKNPGNMSHRDDENLQPNHLLFSDTRKDGKTLQSEVEKRKVNTANKEAPVNRG